MDHAENKYTEKYVELGREFTAILSSTDELNKFVTFVLSQFMTSQEAAEELGVSRVRVQQMMSEGKLSYAVTPYGRIIPKIALEHYKTERLREIAEKLAAWPESIEGKKAQAEAERLAQERFEELKAQELEKARQEIRREVEEEIEVMKKGLAPEEFDWVAKNYARMSSEQRAKVLEEARRNLAEKQQNSEAEKEATT